MNQEYCLRTREEWIEHIKKLKDAGFKAYELLANEYDVESIWEVYVG